MSRPAEHGTDGGYYRHRRTTKTEPCADCLRAHTEATLKREQARKARRRADREAKRIAAQTCPTCGARKSPKGQHCRKCARRTFKRRAAHGTDSGYYHELRHGEVPCTDCTRAHTQAAARNRKPRKPEAGHPCVDCGTSVSPKALRCRSCASKRNNHHRHEPVIRWVQRRGVWRAAA